MRRLTPTNNDPAGHIILVLLQHGLRKPKSGANRTREQVSARDMRRHQRATRVSSSVYRNECEKSLKLFRPGKNSRTATDVFVVEHHSLRNEDGD
jgi:hypothetical protein